MFNTHETVPYIKATMNPNNKKSVTRLLTVPNTSSEPVDSAGPENKDVNERIADLESTIKKLQLELIDLTSQQESSKESSNMNIRPRSKIDSTMHFEHVSLINDHEENTRDTVNFPRIKLKSDHEEDTGDITNNPNVQQLNQLEYSMVDHSEDELNTMITDLKAELQAKLKDLKDVVHDEDNEELVTNLNFDKFH